MRQRAKAGIRACPEVAVCYILRHAPEGPLGTGKGLGGDRQRAGIVPGRGVQLRAAWFGMDGGESSRPGPEESASGRAGGAARRRGGRQGAGERAAAGGVGGGGAARRTQGNS